MKVSTAFGIPLYLHWTLFAFLSFMWYSQPESFLFLLSAFLFVTLHEYGHALMAKWYGLPVADITLYPFGGAARIGFEYNDYKEELFVTIAGPMVNVFLAAIFSLCMIYSENSYFEMCFFVNVVLIVFNLLPVIPLDGGRIFRAILHKLLGSFVRATVYAAGVGQFIAGGLILFSVVYNLWIWVFIFSWTIFAAQHELSVAQKVNSFSSLKIKLAEVLGREEFKSTNLGEMILLLKSISEKEKEQYCLQDLIQLLEEIHEIDS